MILQLVRPQLSHQTDAPALLLFIEQDSRSSLADLAQRQLQLQPAIAAQRAENIACKALRMNAHQRRRSVNIPHHQRHQTLDAPAMLGRFLATRSRLRQIPLKTKNAKMPPPRG